MSDQIVQAQLICKILIFQLFGKFIKELYTTPIFHEKIQLTALTFTLHSKRFSLQNIFGNSFKVVQ